MSSYKYIPSLILEILLFIKYKISFLLYKKEILKNNIRIKTLKTTKSAFLLATGPSITEQDLNLLKGKDCFSVSNFFLHKDLKNINPILHFFAPYHKPMILSEYIEWLRSSDLILPAKTSVVLGHTTKKIIDDNDLFPNRNVYYIYLTPNATDNFNILKPISVPSTGPQMILPILYFMGYTKIFLVGCDHDILKNYNSNLQHFYDNKLDVRTNASRNYIWPDIISELKSNLKVFELYNHYNKIAKNNGIKIVNLSPTSWLDIFEKRDYLSTINSLDI